MAYILLLLDILIYNLTSYNTYFFLISILLFNKKEFNKIIIIGLIIDLIITNKPFLNTIILSIIFIINKKYLKLYKRKLKDYVLLNIFNFMIYYASLSIITGCFNIYTFLINIIINYTFYVLSYNSLKKYIKLARWLHE